MEELTPAEALMAEIAANLAALTEHAMERINQPPRGAIKEVGHYRVLNQSLKRKELDALQQLLDEVAYNVAATIFATLDGSIGSDLPTFPEIAVIDRRSGEPLADNLHQSFTELWEEDAEE